MRKLVHRPRRLRRTAALRDLVRETNLSPHDFILPLFVNENISARRAISSMPGVDQLAPNEIAAEAAKACGTGLQAVLLFGIPAKKTIRLPAPTSRMASSNKRSGRSKHECPELTVITDVCLCEYMSHGHCGVTRIDGDHFHVLNDESVELLVKTSLSHAAAGADLVAPSDMMDGRIGAIREALDAAGYDQTGHHELRGKIRLLILRSVSRSSRKPAPVRRSAQLSDGSGERR